MKKDKQTNSFPLAGADETTCSKSEYFSWIYHTNEGATEEQTLAALAFFRYLREKFSMRLDIFALDAGNLDGAGEGYGDPDGEKLRSQFPRGYSRIVRKAARLQIRLGIWGGADGYGNTEEEAEKRRKILVKLCEEYNFALFKFDTVCGSLRPEKRKEFAKTMRLCRKFCPDLILLNHRNDLAEASRYATTFLWEGHETYADVHNFNPCTAPHNRACMFFRGHTPELKRLAEDHGVCISSSPAYFEDELVYQAFNRCLILAPEIYSNPWLLKDGELPSLARVFNLHRRYRSILTEGMLPPHEYDSGDNAVFRGDGKRRFLATGNGSWRKRKISFFLDEKIGLAPCDKVCVTRRFPTETLCGIYPYGAEFEAELPAFRAALFEICDAEEAEMQLAGCEYFVLKENDEGRIETVELLCGTPRLCSPSSGESAALGGEVTDVRTREPLLLGSLAPVPVPENAREMYETMCFFCDNESLEARALRRAGQSNIPEVNAVREQFFTQKSYRMRGLDPAIPFDGTDSAFDFKSRSYLNFDGRVGFRVKGGCLRVDLGEIPPADRVEIEYFEAEENLPEFAPLPPCRDGENSDDLKTWKRAFLERTETVKKCSLEYLEFYVDIPKCVHGVRKKAVFTLSAPARFFLLDEPFDHIFSISAFRNGKKIPLGKPHLTNLFAPYKFKKTRSARAGKFTLENLPSRPYLAVAAEGVTGNENAACVLERDGVLYPFPERAPAYPSNAFEYPVHPVDGFYTFFFPLDKAWEGACVTVHVLFAGSDVPVDVWLCDGHNDRKGKVLELPKG